VARFGLSQKVAKLKQSHPIGMLIKPEKKVVGMAL
jgi:hypothetical protein